MIKYLPVCILFVVVLILIAVDFSIIRPAFADILSNTSKERIGNYDVQLLADPKNPIAGKPAHIQIRIAGVNGDELVNVPAQIRIIDSQNKVLQWTSPQVIPAGHYIYQYTFPQPGQYIVYVDLKDDSYSGGILTFTFFVNVVGPFDYIYPIIAAVGVLTAGAIGAIVFMKKRRQQQMHTDLR
jgi:hypothetical protein